MGGGFLFRLFFYSTVLHCSISLEIFRHGMIYYIIRTFYMFQNLCIHQGFISAFLVKYWNRYAPRSLTARGRGEERIGEKRREQKRGRGEELRKEENRRQGEKRRREEREREGEKRERERERQRERGVRKRREGGKGGRGQKGGRQ